MYLGKFVEVGKTDQIFLNPVHPYTQALLKSRSEIDPFNQDVKYVIYGEVPSPLAPPPGCTFNPRCVSDARTPECEIELPHKIKIEDGHYIWCVNPPTGVDIIEETDFDTNDVEEIVYRIPKKRIKNTIMLALFNSIIMVISFFEITNIHYFVPHYYVIGAFWFAFQFYAIYRDYYDYEHHSTKLSEVGFLARIIGLTWHVNAGYYYILNALYLILTAVLVDSIIFFYLGVYPGIYFKSAMILWGISSAINILAGLLALPPRIKKS